jgi:hypothetical protein
MSPNYSSALTIHRAKCILFLFHHLILPYLLLCLIPCYPHCHYVNVASVLQIRFCFIYRFGCSNLTYIIVLHVLKFEFWRTMHGKQAPTPWQNWNSSLTAAFEKCDNLLLTSSNFFVLLSALPAAPRTNQLPPNRIPIHLILLYSTKICHENWSYTKVYPKVSGQCS